MYRVVLAACVALLPLAGRADPAPVGGFQPIVVFQTRPEKVGDRYDYVVDVDSHVTRDGVPSDAHESQRFSLEVVHVDQTGMVVRFIQRDIQEPGPATSPSAMLSRAWNGVPVDFATGLNGYPKGLVDAAAVKAQVEASFEKLGPDAVAIAPDLKQQLDGAPDDQFMSRIGARLLTLAAMQYRGPVKIGRENGPPQQHADADGGIVTVKSFTDISLSPTTPCSVLVKRSDWTERPPGAAQVSSSLDTEATVAEDDGWVISLPEASKLVLPTAQQTRTVKISRVAPGGVCAK